MAGVSVKKTQSEKDHNQEQNEFIDWWEEICKGSATAGMLYLARKDLHWTERLFWLAAIVAAAFYAINSCLSQWQRFRDNPIVYEYEYLFPLRSFPILAVTLCTQFTDPLDNHSLIDFEDVVKKYMPNADHNEKVYNMKLLLTLSRLQYNNLDMLIPFENDTIAQNKDVLQMVSLLHTTRSTASFIDVKTEMGLCKGTPNKLNEGMEETQEETKCSYFDNCQITVKPNWPGARVILFIHDANEMPLLHDRHSLTIDVGTQNSYVLKILLNPISAEEEVRNLPIAYRKCRYSDENNLQNFDHYSPSLCRVDCHINSALELCNCKPFFYAQTDDYNVCSVPGMVCLARKNWLSRPCNCLPLCKEVSYTVIEQLVQSGGGSQYAGAHFERTIIIQQELAKMGMKRRVVFSTDQLIMSFGGAIGLFLGASFMSMYGLTYLALYFLFVKCKFRSQAKRTKAPAFRGPRYKI